MLRNDDVLVVGNTLGNTLANTFLSRYTVKNT